MRAVLTDVEGTTTSIALVKDVLFPYARRRLASFVRAQGDTPEVRAVLDDVRRAEQSPDLDADGVVSVLERWMDEDRKATPLKTLQGWMWRDGYLTGELRGHVYEDAVTALRAWRAHGMALFVFSSGSVAAQRLLFAHTPFGDLTPLFSGYFDTTVGGKLEPRSYEAIAQSIDTAPRDILFLSDHVGELDTARAAGLATVWVDRGATERPATGPHPRVTTFADIDLDRAR
jgi:enolase-phosphatase E1